MPHTLNHDYVSPADLNKEVAALIIAVIVAIFSVVGGVGGVLYVAYAATGFVMAAALVYFCDMFFDPLSRAGQCNNFKQLI